MISRTRGSSSYECLRGSAAYQTALGFEIVAVAVGAYGLTQGSYIPGTTVGIAALIRLLDANVKAAFLAGGQRQQYAQQQQYNPQFGNPQFGVPPPPPPPAAGR